MKRRNLLLWRREGDIRKNIEKLWNIKNRKKVEEKGDFAELKEEEQLSGDEWDEENEEKMNHQVIRWRGIPIKQHKVSQLHCGAW